MYSYQLHHKHAHLLEFDHECSTCGLYFLSRHRSQTHRCVPHRRRVNIKKREVLAARMREKMQLTSEPYFVFVDSENQLMPCVGDNEGTVKEVSFEQSFPAGVDSIRTDEANSNNSVDRLENEDTSGSSFLQNDLFHLTENSSVLSCFPKCEQELLQSAAMETLSADLEMDVCDSLELKDDGGAAVEQSAAAVSPASDNLLADVDDQEIPAENGVMSEDVDRQECPSELRVVAEQSESSKSGDDASDRGKGQHWPMATALGDGRLQCNVCRKELRVTNYYPHMRRVHKMPSSQTRPITWQVCDRCGYQCQGNYKMRRHAMKHARYGTFTGKLFKLDLGSSMYVC